MFILLFLISRCTNKHITICSLEELILTDIKEVHIIPIVSILHLTGHNSKSHDLTKDQYVRFAGVDLDLWIIALVGQTISCHSKQVSATRNDLVKRISKTKAAEDWQRFLLGSSICD